MLVGPRICRAVVDQFPNVRDPNRGGRPRTDFIFTRVDGSAYRTHPGVRPKNDAKPFYCPPSRATEQTLVCRWHRSDELQCFTFEDARRIPQPDRAGNAEAFRRLQTNPDDFPWWLPAANLGNHTEHAVGTGLVAGTLVAFSDAHAVLRFDRGTGRSVHVELLNMRGAGIKTNVYG